MNHSLDALFKPSSVALIGASAKEYSIGNVIIKNLIHYGYKGKIFPVNPKEKSILGLKTFRSVSEIKESIDLVHIIIPPLSVPKEVENCGKKGVKVIIINSAGFKEMGKKGGKIEAEFLAKAKKYNIRILGPNCQGIINSDPAVKAYCNFTFSYFKPGHISVVAQSGGVGQIITQALHDKGTGIRLYASNGNASDISITEIIRYYGKDKNTRVILLCIESIADSKEFVDAVKEVVKVKPVLAISSGSTEKGAEASRSHTGGLASGKFMETMFEKTGILFFNSLDDICNAAIAFSTQPVPKGNRIGIITNTGGPAIIATDELVKNGMIIPSLTDKIKKQLAKHLLTASSISNPLDILATADALHFKKAIKIMVNEPEIDCIYITFVTPLFVDCVSVAKEIETISKAYKKTIVCNLITDKKVWKDTVDELYKGGVPIYNFPETAAKVLSAMVKYNELRNRAKGSVIQFTGIKKNTVKKILTKAKSQKRNVLNASEVFEILKAYHIPVAECYLVVNEKEVIKAAEKIGYPVVIKADSRNIVHKSDKGGVVLNLNNVKEVVTAIRKIMEKLASRDLKFFVQKQLPSGKEIIIGAKAEPGNGHLIMFGMGGVLVDLYKDFALELSPVTDAEANRMIAKTKASVLFNDYRGMPGINKHVVLEIIQRISQLVCDFPMIKELDMNPIIADSKKAVVVDARIICS